MIVNVVKKVHSCSECPNFSSVPSLGRDVSSINYICIAGMNVIGTSDSLGSRMKLKNKVSELCPFKNDEVNQRPRRER